MWRYEADSQTNRDGHEAFPQTLFDVCSFIIQRSAPLPGNIGPWFLPKAREVTCGPTLRVLPVTYVSLVRLLHLAPHDSGPSPDKWHTSCTVPVVVLGAPEHELSVGRFRAGHSGVEAINCRRPTWVSQL